MQEFGARLPPAPTYKPVTALNAHGGDVVRPNSCRWLNYEGEIAIVIGRTCTTSRPAKPWPTLKATAVANDYGVHDFHRRWSASFRCYTYKGSAALCRIIRGWSPTGQVSGNCAPLT